MSEEDKLQNDILLYYCENILPLLLELKLRRGDDHLLGINNEIRALNDHIARCYSESENITSQQRMEQLSKAEGHVRRLILDCFKQLNMDLFSKIESIEKKYYSNLWLYWGENGEFWEQYTSFRSKAQENVLQAKKKEAFDQDEALAKYEIAFQCYREKENMLLQKKKELCWSRIYRWGTYISKWGKFVLITFILSLIASVISLFLIG